MAIRALVLAMLAGLVALFSLVACGSNDATQTAEAPTKEVEEAQENATKEAEEATKEAEKSLDQKLKDADLMSCQDLEDAVKLRANLTLNTFGDVKDLDDHKLVGVVVDGDTPSVTCSAKANLDNDFDGYMYIRYVAEWKEGILTVSVSEDTRQSREEATVERSPAIVAGEPTATLAPTATSEPLPTPTRNPDMSCPTDSEQAYFDDITQWGIPIAIHKDNLNNSRNVESALNSYIALAENIEEAESPETAQSVQVKVVRFAEVIREFVDSYSLGAENQDMVAIDEAWEKFDEGHRGMLLSIKEFCP